jgi:Hypothetical glycosyl hydrolase family 15
MDGVMRRTSKFGAIAGVALAMLVGATSAGAATSAAGHLRYAVDNNPNFAQLSQTAQRNGYVILTPARLNRAMEIKAANPNVKVLVYKNLTGSRTDCTAGPCTAGVAYQQADAQHPEWFLLNQQGARIRFKDYPDLWAMDVGSASYQSRWADNVIAEVRRDGWDGVFLDDANTTMKYHYAVSNIAKYPSDSAWQSATRSALAAIGPRIRAAGKLAIANIGTWHEYPAVGDSWLSYLDGGMQEHFAKWGRWPDSGYADQGTWQKQLSSVKYAQAHGKVFLGVTNSSDGDRAAARYGWASTLLAAQGKADFALHSNYTNENWFPEYDYDIGNPTGPESTDANGVHRRVFTNGIVVVNPTGSTLTANLNGTYSGSGMTGVSSVTLAAHSGYVLAGIGAPPTTTKVTHTPGGHGKGGKVKGSVKTSGAGVKPAGASTAGPVGGRVRLRLYRKCGRRWCSVARARPARLNRAGQFRQRLSAFRRGRLRPGTYRIRARYLGSRNAAPSTSRFRKFRLRR